jgi:uncharacterized membrane protein
VTRDAAGIRLCVRSWVLGTLALLGLGVCVAALRTQAWPSSALLFAVLVVPLLLPLKGLLRGDRRTHAWATLCIAPCFVYGITEAIANDSTRFIAAAILIASLAHFVALVAYLRVTRPEGGTQDSPTP